jgi:hypothetical protein
MTHWRITWGHQSWTDRDVNGAHLVAVADLLEQDSWTSISPWTGPKSLAAWIVVLVASQGRELDDALAEVYSAPAADIIAALTTVD